MTALRRIGGRNAISAWSFALTAVVFVIATMLPTTRDRVTGPLEERLLVAILATAVAFVVLALARCTVLRAVDRPSRPGLALGVFAVAGAVQGLGLVILRSRFDLPPIEPWLLVVTRAAAGVVWLSIVAILVDEVRSHNVRVAELVGRIAMLRAVRDREAAERDAVVAALRDETLEPLRQTLDEIGSGLASAGGSERAQAEADRVRRLVEDQVRPASHALFAREIVDATTPDQDARLSRRVRARLILRLATSTLAAPTWLAVGLPLVIAMLFALQGIGLVFALVVSVSWMVVMSACFLLGRRVLEPRLGRMRVWVSSLVLLATYETFAVVALFNNWTWGFLSPLGRWWEWPSLFVLPALWIGIALSRAAQADRDATEERLAATADELAVAQARRRQSLRYEYQRVGRLLHGEVQGSLLSIVRRLERAVPLSSAQRATAVEEAIGQMRSLAERIRGGVAEEWSLDRALADIVALWGPVAAVRLECDPEVAIAAGRDAAARTTIVDVVAEGVTNAVRHGSATALAVRIGRRGDRVVVEIADDGRSTARGRPGMGSRLFDDVSPGWSLETGSDGATLRVEVALDAARDRVVTGV